MVSEYIVACSIDSWERQLVNKVSIERAFLAKDGEQLLCCWVYQLCWQEAWFPLLQFPC